MLSTELRSVVQCLLTISLLTSATESRQHTQKIVLHFSNQPHAEKVTCGTAYG